LLRKPGGAVAFCIWSHPWAWVRLMRGRLSLQEGESRPFRLPGGTVIAFMLSAALKRERCGLSFAAGSPPSCVAT
jgi:hypothetical protein